MSMTLSSPNLRRVFGLDQLRGQARFCLRVTPQLQLNPNSRDEATKLDAKLDVRRGLGTFVWINTGTCRMDQHWVCMNQ